MKNTAKDSIATRRIAFLCADGVDETSFNTMKKALEGKGAVVKVIAPKLGFINGSGKTPIKVDESFLTAASVVYDAVFIPAGEKSVTALSGEANAVHFVNEAYKHCKAIAAANADAFLKASYISTEGHDDGVTVSRNSFFEKSFIKAIAQHRFWERETARKVPA
jgi:catalase